VLGRLGTENEPTALCASGTEGSLGVASELFFKQTIMFDRSVNLNMGNPSLFLGPKGSFPNARPARAIRRTRSHTVP
jgi:hypothetical protein